MTRHSWKSLLFKIYLLLFFFLGVHPAQANPVLFEKDFPENTFHILGFSPSGKSILIHRIRNLSVKCEQAYFRDNLLKKHTMGSEYQVEFLSVLSWQPTALKHYYLGRFKELYAEDPNNCYFPNYRQVKRFCKNKKGCNLSRVEKSMGGGNKGTEKFNQYTKRKYNKKFKTLYPFSEKISSFQKRFSPYIHQGPQGPGKEFSVQILLNTPHHKWDKTTLKFQTKAPKLEYGDTRTKTTGALIKLLRKDRIIYSKLWTQTNALSRSEGKTFTLDIFWGPKTQTIAFLIQGQAIRWMRGFIQRPSAHLSIIRADPSLPPLTTIQILGDARTIFRQGHPIQKLLQEKGFDTLFPRRSQKKRKETEIFYANGHKETAQKIASLIPGGGKVSPRSWKSPYPVVLALGSSVLRAIKAQKKKKGR